MGFVTAAILGGMLYDFVKYGVPITVDMVKGKARENVKQWLADEPTTAKIVNHINALSYIDGESEQQYCERLSNDSELTRLFSQGTQIKVVNQKVSHSENTRLAGGNYHEETNHHHHYHDEEHNSIKKF